MAADIWPVTDEFVAEVGDVDLSQPLFDDDWKAIEGAYNRYSVLIFPDQNLTHSVHAAIAGRFGSIDHSMQKSMDVDDERLPSEIADVSNLDADGSVLAEDDRMMGFQRGNRLWHTDSSFKLTPSNASLLYMKSVPPVGGLTEFADMRAAWDELGDDLRQRIEGRIAIHSIATSRARLGFEMTAEENNNYPRVPQAMVRTHRITGRKSVYIASHAGEILDMADSEASELLEQLEAHCTARRFVYSHRWRVNDLVIWDNRCTMHRGRPFDDLRWKRDAQRATSLDIGPTWQQEGLELPDPVAAR
jgi:alpha-ketoglutarate-dependent 2,4-dichlorophenoxyacetate dioxygenase